MNGVREMNGEYEEEVRITPEIYQMLKYTDKLKSMLELQRVYFRFTTDNQSVILRGRNRDNIEASKEDFFNPDVNTFISIKIKDDEINAIFDGTPDEDFTNLNGSITSILTKLSKGKLHEFIPKDKIEDKEFDGENVLIVFVEKSKEQELINKINEFIRSKTIEITIRINPMISENSRPSLKKYLFIGNELAEAKETQNFIRLIKAIQSSISPFNGKEESIFEYDTGHIPFIFVCASSGTGKTQLPFSLDIPMLYLLNNKKMVKNIDNSNTQHIYKNFIEISRCFFECIEKDINIIGFNENNIRGNIGIL